MNYCKYIAIDVVNGEGTRCTLFVAGCEHHCKGCYNKSTWSSEAGFLFDKELENRIIADLQNTRIPLKGLSLSGGDPLMPCNLSAVYSLCERVKRETGKSIWLWTGYTFENLSETQKTILKYVDVLIDGKFVEELKDLSLPFRGSSNQRIIELTPNTIDKDFLRKDIVKAY